MPLNLSRRLTGRVRSSDADRHLGYALCFVAGATNAGGFVAVHQYTSHMTGVLAAVADQVAHGKFQLALAGASALFAFFVGAACTAIMVNYCRDRGMRSEFALPLALEAVLLLCFGLLGARLSHVDGVFISGVVVLLAFIMGLQNAVITKLSNAEIRTTHITGLVTDAGIEIGKLIYRGSGASLSPSTLVVRTKRLRLLAWLAFFFFMGGIAGTLAFAQIGYLATVPLSLALILVSSMPLVDDLIVYLRKT